ncbi:hypothetical protein [Spirochaeta thermophila]|uniref:hypothetical protein n=1 Tax=Winmispira thermophila TaxID=154 RepID=UPI0002FA5AA7|nr:hypothetical protein [Spirochaeta thermophila]
MNATTNRNTPHLTTIEGEEKLAIPTGIVDYTPAVAKQYTLADRTCRLVIGNAVYPMTCEGLRMEEGQGYLVFRAARPIASLKEIADHPSPSHLPLLHQAGEALETLRAHDFPLPPAALEAIVLLDEGILVLNDDLLQLMREHRPPAADHPLQEEIEDTSWSYTLAFLSYLCITGRSPFGSGTREERLFRRTRKRFPRISPAGETARPFIQWVHQALEGPDRLLLPMPAPPATTVGTVSFDPLEEARIHRAFRVHRFFRRYGAILGGGAAVLGLILLVLISTIQNANRPPATIGLDPLEVARLYYESINRIDPETLRDCLISDDDPVYRELTHLFVIVRVRTAVERTLPLVSPEQWVEEGMPPLPEGTVLYGVADLRLSTLQETSEQATVEAAYLRWTLEPGDPETGTPATSSPSRIEEILELVFLGDRWAIRQKKVIEETPLSQEEALEALSARAPAQ